MKRVKYVITAELYTWKELREMMDPWEWHMFNNLVLHHDFYVDLGIDFNGDEENLIDYLEDIDSHYQEYLEKYEGLFTHNGRKFHPPQFYYNDGVDIEEVEEAKLK